MGTGSFWADGMFWNQIEAVVAQHQGAIVLLSFMLGVFYHNLKKVKEGTESPSAVAQILDKRERWGPL